METSTKYGEQPYKGNESPKVPVTDRRRLNPNAFMDVMRQDAEQAEKAIKQLEEK